MTAAGQSIWACPVLLPCRRVARTNPGGPLGPAFRSDYPASGSNGSGDEEACANSPFSRAPGPRIALFESVGDRKGQKRSPLRCRTSQRET